MNLAGFPPTTFHGSTLRNTAALAPTTAPSPIVTPGPTNASAATQELSFNVIGDWSNGTNVAKPHNHLQYRSSTCYKAQRQDQRKHDRSLNSMEHKFYMSHRYTHLCLLLLRTLSKELCAILKIYGLAMFWKEKDLLYTKHIAIRNVVFLLYNLINSWVAQHVI